MNRATKIKGLPVLTDNVFVNLWREDRMKTILSLVGFNKRSGTPMHEVMYNLVRWLCY